MLKVIGWVMGNLPLLVGLVTVTVSVVESISGYLRERGPEKKARAVTLIREALPTLISLPPWLAPHIDGIIAMLVDVVIFILNTTRGHEWAKETEAVVVPPVPAAQSVTVTTQQRDATDARLDELTRNLERPK